MTRDEISKILKEIIVQNSLVKVDTMDILPDCDLINDFSFDSIAFIKLIAEIEEAFNIEFEYQFLNEDVLGTYQSLEKYIIERIENRA